MRFNHYKSFLIIGNIIVVYCKPLKYNKQKYLLLAAQRKSVRVTHFLDLQCRLVSHSFLIFLIRWRSKNANAFSFSGRNANINAITIAFNIKQLKENFILLPTTYQPSTQDCNMYPTKSANCSYENILQFYLHIMNHNQVSTKYLYQLFVMYFSTFIKSFDVYTDHGCSEYQMIVNNTDTYIFTLIIILLQYCIKSYQQLSNQDINKRFVPFVYNSSAARL